MQIRHQVVQLLLSQLLLEGRHLGAAQQDDVGDPVVVGGNAIFHEWLLEQPAYSTHDLRAPSLNGLFKKPFMKNGIAANDDRVTDIILLGRAKMPAFQQKLTQQQLDDLTAYLHTL